jgi:hypothetical protein
MTFLVGCAAIFLIACVSVGAVVVYLSEKALKETERLVRWK